MDCNHRPEDGVDEPVEESRTSWEPIVQELPDAGAGLDPRECCGAEEVKQNSACDEDAESLWGRVGGDDDITETK
ncbi:hypothetical protein HG530_004387 [Fusarium avenaceum]|nr:hypothetical protein HG530_004387 [Fusarium avenaceum]